MVRETTRLAVCLLSLMLIGFVSAEATVTDSACEVDTQCTASFPNTECASGKCKCVDTHVTNAEKKKCLAKATVTDSACEVDTQCTASFPNTECASGKCKCVDTHVTNAEKKKCLAKATSLDSTCDEPSQCIALSANTECKSSKCKCLDTHVDSGDKKNCLAKATSLDSTCDETSQCIASFSNTECKSNKCKCLDSHVDSGDKKKCLAKATSLDSTCDETSQCIASFSNTECKSSKCKCLDSHVDSGDKKKCLAKATSLDSTCDETSQCIALSANTECKSNKCKCLDSHVDSGDKKKCLAKATSLDSTCDETSQCIASFSNTECKSSKCKCLDSHVDSGDKKKCLAKLNTGCKAKDDCTLSEAAERVNCTNDVCQCTTLFLPDVINNKCIKSVKVGDKCNTNDLFCGILGATCTEEKCKCMTGATPSNNMDDCNQALIGERCTDVNQCLYTKTSCESADGLKVCTCASTQVASSKRMVCLAKMKYHATCTESQQCDYLGEKECIQNICKCKANNHYSGAQCWNDRKLDETCTDNQECLLANGLLNRTDCTNKKCVCTSDFKADISKNLCNAGVRNAVALILVGFFFVATTVL